MDKCIVRGHLTNLLFIILFISLALTQRFLLNRANRKKREEKAKLSPEDLQDILESDTRVGDESLDFIYRL